MTGTACLASACVLLLLISLDPVRGTSTSMSCYVCNSYSNKSCSPHVNRKYQRQCPPDSVGCRKVLFEFTDSEGPHQRVFRQCAHTATPDLSCQEVYGTNGAKYRSVYCECLGHLCNSAPSPPALITLTAAALLLSLTAAN